MKRHWGYPRQKIQTKTHHPTGRRRYMLCLSTSLVYNAEAHSKGGWRTQAKEAERLGSVTAGPNTTLQPQMGFRLQLQGLTALGGGLSVSVHGMVIQNQHHSEWSRSMKRIRAGASYKMQSKKRRVVCWIASFFFFFFKHCPFQRTMFSCPLSICFYL